MEYLFYAGFLILGWVLSKVDTAARIKSVITDKLKDVAQEAFNAGVQYGHEVTLQAQKAEGSETQSQTFGFDLKSRKD